MSSSGSWLSSGAKWVREKAGYATSADATANNEAQLLQLQSQYEHELKMAKQYELNAIRLETAGKRQAARTALAHKREAEANANRTAGKIATLHGVTSNLRSMESNLEMTRSIKVSNSVSARMTGQLNTEEVDAVMDEARDHKDAHRDISAALSGENYLEPFDEDDADAELDALMGKVRVDPLHPANAPLPRQQSSVAPDPRAAMETPAQKAAREDEVLRREKVANDILDQMPPAPTKDHRRPLPGAIKTRPPK